MPQLHVASSSLKQKSNGEEHVKAFSHWLVALAAVVGCTLPAQAQNYPTHPITLTIGFPAGGPSDITARIMAEHMGPTLGQPVVVEPVTGASGTIASAKVARAAPDGYSIVLGNWTSHVGAPALYPLAYDTFNDFTPVAPLTRTYLWIIGRNTLPANNVKELVAWLKANPGKATAGTVGVGSAAHLCLLDFANKTGTKFQYIPYRGGAPVMQDVLGGQIDIACIEVSQTLPLVRSGKIKAFGVVADKRSPAAPEIPTLAQAGVPNVELVFWQALWAPKGTPKPIIAKLNDAVRKTFADPAVQKRFAALGHEVPSPDQLSSEALAKYHKAEIDKWWPIIKAAGIKVK